VDWLRTVPRDEQFTSAIVIAELYRGAFRSEHTERHVQNIEKRVLPSVTTLPFDVGVARVYGELDAGMKRAGTPLADADLQIAATAIHWGLQLVTGNLRHFARITGLPLCRALADARA
jgi:predicted nucleic acid-binding protein